MRFRPVKCGDTNRCVRSPIALLGALVMMLTLLLSMPMLSARAEEVFFYPSWEEYKAAGEPAASWNDAASAIDKCLEASYTLYVQGDKETAYTACLNTYNFYYETSGFERNVNGYSGSEVSKAELQFKTARKAVKKDLGEETIAAEFNKLSEILHIQANHLDGLGDSGESQLNLTGEVSAPAETDAAAETEAAAEQATETAEEAQEPLAAAAAAAEAVAHAAEAEDDAVEETAEMPAGQTEAPAEMAEAGEPTVQEMQKTLAQMQQSIADLQKQIADLQQALAGRQ